jgi:conjugative transposon TraN protein
MMKYLFFFLLALPSYCQLAYVQPIDKNAYRISYDIQVSATKTTHLIFPHEIKYADIGSKDLVGEAVTNAGNVFRVKSVQPGIAETNLTVITSDGRLFSFRVNYEESPLVLTYDLGHLALSGDVSKSAQLSGSSTRLSDNLNALGMQAMSSKRRIKHIGTQVQGVSMFLKDILYKEDVMFLVIGLENRSKLDYELDFIQLHVSQFKKAGESSAAQDVPIDAIKLFDVKETMVVRKGELTKVIAVNRLTLEKDRQLLVQVGEKDGGRLITLAIGPEELSAAKPF